MGRAKNKDKKVSLVHVKLCAAVALRYLQPGLLLVEKFDHYDLIESNHSD